MVLQRLLLALQNGKSVWVCDSSVSVTTVTLEAESGHFGGSATVYEHV